MTCITSHLQGRELGSAQQGSDGAKAKGVCGVDVGVMDGRCDEAGLGISAGKKPAMRLVSFWGDLQQPTGKL